MKQVTLDEKTKATLDSFTFEQLLPHYAVFHELFQYGVEAVAHVHLMRELQKALSGGIPLDDIIGKYLLEFQKSKVIGLGFFGDLASFIREGIFIPHLAMNLRCPDRNEGKVRFFAGDYISRIIYNPAWRSEGKELALALRNRVWIPSDLQNRELVEMGLVFGRDLWDTCASGFESRIGGGYPLQRNNDGPLEFEKPIPQIIAKPAKQLLMYYESIVKMATNLSYSK